MSEEEPTAEARMAEGFALAQATRREFVQSLGLVAGAVAAAGCAPLGGQGAWEKYFHAHYTRMTEEQKHRLIERLEADARRRYGVEVDIRDPRPRPGVEFAYCLNLSACIGCRRCEYACAQENNT